jgi:hypothetical protein
LSDFIKENPSLNGSINDISSNEGFQVALILSSVYRNGNRNDIIFALSGFLRHGEYSLNATETIVNQLCQMTDDEEIENRLVVVRKTYDNNGKPITGRNELFEILERAVGLETASQIINGIPQLLDKKRDPVVSQLNSNVRNELFGHIYETVCYDPPTLVVAHSIKKQIIKCKIVRYSRDDDAAEMQQSLRFGEVILNVIPEEIIRYESPLNKDQFKYKIRFTTPFGESFTTQPKSLDKIVSDPKIRSLTYKPRTAEESLNAILNGAQRAQRVSVVRQIETAGFSHRILIPFLLLDNILF